MTYAMIGAGKIATALARVFAQKKIPLHIANSRGPETLAELTTELGPTVQAVSLEDAYKADLIFLAVNYPRHNKLAQHFPDWKGKILIDMMNAFGVPAEELGGQVSSEIVAKAFVGGRLVKAFNHLPAAQLGMQAPASQHQAIFVSGDDAQANSAVVELAKQLGFAPIELGSLHRGGAPLHVQGKALGGLLLQNLFKLD